MSDEYSHDVDVADDVGEDYAERQRKTRELIDFHLNIIRMVDMVKLARDQMESVYNNMPAMELDNEYDSVFNMDLDNNKLEIH